MRREDQAKPKQRDVTQARPNPGQAWVCGYAELGQSCGSGPTCDGRCGRAVAQALLETGDNSGLEPVQAISQATAEELPPCIPRRSVAVRRQNLRLNLAILTAGVLLLCLTLPSREKSFVPGELSAKHAQILDNRVASERCSLCHPTSHGPESTAPKQAALVADVLETARRLVANDGRQDKLCMQCHQSHMPNASSRDPHDLSRRCGNV